GVRAHRWAKVYANAVSAVVFGPRVDGHPGSIVKSYGQRPAVARNTRCRWLKRFTTRAKRDVVASWRQQPRAQQIARGADAHAQRLRRSIVEPHVQPARFVDGLETKFEHDAQGNAAGVVHYPRGLVGHPAPRACLVMFVFEEARVGSHDDRGRSCRDGVDTRRREVGSGRQSGRRSVEQSESVSAIGPPNDDVRVAERGKLRAEEWIAARGDRAAEKAEAMAREPGCVRVGQ